MTREKLFLGHGPLLEKRLSSIQLDISEYCFPNLYLFRNTHEYEVLKDGDFIYIAGRTYDGKSYLMPTSDLLETNPLETESFKKAAADFDMIFPISESWLDLFPEEEYRREYSEDDTDYIFTSGKLSRYPGRKLHKKRNLLKQFNEMYTPSLERITPENLGETRRLLDQWQEATGLRPEETDYYPCLEAINLKDELKLCGALFLADGKPEGFILGEDINPRMYGIHFAKGNKDIKGLYQYIFSRTAELMEDEYDFFNMEQDLGNSSLRTAKSSYQPDHMARKYRLFPIG